MYDYKSWLEPFASQLSNHIYPHAFKFEEKEGTVQMFYKSWASDELWLPNEDSGLNYLEIAMSIDITLAPKIILDFQQ